MDEAKITADMTKRKTMDTSLADTARSFVRACSGFAMLLAQLAIAAYVGSQLGANFSTATISKDCQQVGTAKVGETYIKCDLLPRKKDPESAPPR